MIRILIADDQPLIRMGLRGMLEARNNFEVVGEATDGEQAHLLSRDLLPDVVLMDLRMPRVDGIEAISRIRRDPRLRLVRVVVLTTFEDQENVVAALTAGAVGFLSKSVGPSELADKISAVAAGGPGLSDDATLALLDNLKTPRSEVLQSGQHTELSALTDREQMIVARAAHGVSNDDIAKELFISPYTVKTHINRAMTKLGARDRSQLVVIAIEAGLGRPR